MLNQKIHHFILNLFQDLRSSKTSVIKLGIPDQVRNDKKKYAKK
ncbi:MAG: hypothetical protein WCJ51_01205 [Candidatus Moraniibacteriota bacterium]